MKKVSLRCSTISWPTSRLTFALLALLGPGVGPTLGQSSPDIGAIVEGVAKAYKNPLPYEIVKITTMQLGAAGIFKSKTRLVLQDTNKFRLEIDNPIEMEGLPSMVIIGDGNEVWQVSPDFKKYTKTKPDDPAEVRTWVEAEAAMFEVPEGLLKEIGNLTFVREESLALDGNNIDCFVLKLVLPGHAEWDTLWVEKTRFLIRRARIEEGPDADTEGQTASITTDFPIVNIGVASPDSTFVFTPSPTAIEVDKMVP
jgi:outer membrane lipoprotein-sorting protein